MNNRYRSPEARPPPTNRPLVCQGARNAPDPHGGDPRRTDHHHGPGAEIDRSGNPYVDQFIHGRAEGPIRMQVKRF
jgi:hypothetical protein